MSELLPTVQADDIRESLLAYLTTTFALTDDDARSALVDFLEDPENGLFKGPYMRLRLPFQPAAPDWHSLLDWRPGFTPYSHQAAAFARLSTAHLDPGQRRPLPTLVTTGTGSGKTEAFLIPILDHVLRAKRAGVTGMKALVLYPMNALANDQASRLTAMLNSDPALAGVTAALYTGQQGPSHTKVTSDSLITDRAVIRSDPPDVLLTNYKMLDQLLLRHEDMHLWEASAYGLQYLVLDEFHTYDGAQGTDVSMLLRRLGLALKSYWTPGDPRLDTDDWFRPLGRLTPVATSATLGHQGDPEAMRTFAETVFGEPFSPEAVITETRLDADQWISDAETRIADQGYTPVPIDDRLAITMIEAWRDLPEHADGRRLAETVFGYLWQPEGGAPGSRLDLAGAPADQLLDLVKAHPVTRGLLNATTNAASIEAVVHLLSGDPILSPGDAAAHRRRWRAFATALVAAFSHVRAVAGRQALSVEMHLWVRELTRIDRLASTLARYRWSDDGEVTPAGPGESGDLNPGIPLPAVFCRHCGRSGWGILLAPTGSDLAADDANIRGRHASHDDRFRALIYAPAEGDRSAQAGEAPGGRPIEGLRWFAVGERRLLAEPPDDVEDLRRGGILPVLTQLGSEAGQRSVDDTCPACQQKDGIRFLGSAIATLLSVTVSTLFGEAQLDRQEKKALVFTDSVQDAAHRAGFVQSRSFSLTQRAVLHDGLGTQPVDLDTLVDQVVASAGNDRYRRYRLLPPELADRQEFTPFWQRNRLAEVPAAVRTRVKRRLLLDAVLEFGLQSGIGRTLERTGSAAAEVHVPAVTLLRAADLAIEEAGGLPTLPGTSDIDERAKTAWVRGVLERMRTRGAIAHEWFRRYEQEDGNRYSIWGGRQRADGMPAFPAGRTAPGYPRVGGAKLARETDLEPVTSPQSWHAQWAAKTLDLSRDDGAKLARLLLQRLARLDVIGEITSNSGARVYELPASRVVAGRISLPDLEAGRHVLVCHLCQNQVPGTSIVVDQLDGAPCMVARCSGRLERRIGADNFYRRLYASTDMRRVVAREHTSLLDDKTRQAYENGFRSAQDDPQAPNVLVATPTLEMGIDIGDLSTVLLASLPRSVASYLQRVGRAGRLTGNALNIAMVTGRGDQLPRLGDPLSVINGEVRPPATYLDAEEILRRQYLASLADRMARDARAPHPHDAAEAIGHTDAGSFLDSWITEAESDPTARLDEFLRGFPTLGKEAVASLRSWAAPLSDIPRSSKLAQRLLTEAELWAQEVQTVAQREAEIQAAIPELIQRDQGPAASDDDHRALRIARSSLRLLRSQMKELRGNYWIGALEERGLLPNYTLLDDSVTLDATLSWIDPDSDEYQTDSLSYHRRGPDALRDFAPGNSFYAGGHRLVIDAVDLGRDGEAIHAWVFCPACGYVDDQGRTLPACPRCGSPHIADTSQLLEAVELTRVYSAMSRDDAVITDDRDERDRERFSIITEADIDPEHITRRWFVEGYDFGANHLRDQVIREVNLGRTATQSPLRTLGGEERPAAQFRICPSCGQIDTISGGNKASQHRPWCPNRRSPTEQVRSVVLARTLRTEGLLIRLPTSVTLGDPFAQPSVSAAILLGLRERIGGAPDHLRITTTVDPTFSDGTDNHKALLLHDIVPGGTGYLAELADPETVWTMLYQSWKIVRDCPCQHEQRLACHRCLLPFAAPNQMRWVARAAAERHLRDILTSGSGGDPTPTMGWVTTTEEPSGSEPESALEQRLRHLLVKRLEALGATIKEHPTSWGNRATITLGGSGRVWTLEPQQLTSGSSPDFVLRCNQGGIPDLAIFTDGWRYHASGEINRLADDAVKRAALRQSGWVVVSVTWQDLDQADSHASSPPPWYNAEQAADIMASTAGQLSPQAIDLITGGPVELILSWIREPKPDLLEHLADWLPLFLSGATSHIGVIGDRSLATAAATALDDAFLPPINGAMDWIWRDDTVALAASVNPGSAAPVPAAVVLDDRPTHLGPDHQQAWREWLRLGNLLNLGTAAPTITTWSLASAPGLVAAPIAPAGALLAPEWQDLVDNATDEEARLIRALASTGLPRPEQGLETPEGIALGLSWSAKRVAVDLGLSDEDRRDLAGTWQLVAPATEAINAVLLGGDS